MDSFMCTCLCVHIQNPHKHKLSHTIPYVFKFSMACRLTPKHACQSTMSQHVHTEMLIHQDKRKCTYGTHFHTATRNRQMSHAAVPLHVLRPHTVMCWTHSWQIPDSVFVAVEQACHNKAPQLRILFALFRTRTSTVCCCAKQAKCCLRFSAFLRRKNAFRPMGSQCLSLRDHLHIRTQHS